jgi:hypothetical protein
MKTIPLTRGQVTIVDDNDYQDLAQYKWRFTPQDGAIRSLGKRDGVDWREYRLQEYMHRRLMKCPAHLCVDHINHDNLDNRRCNLRLATIGENLRNKLKHKGTSRYKGVSYNTKRNKWYAFIGMNYQSIYLGSYDNQWAAAWVYDSAARLLHKHFAYTNFSEPTLDDLTQAHITAGMNNLEALGAAIEARNMILGAAENIVSHL